MDILLIRIPDQLIIVITESADDLLAKVYKSNPKTKDIRSATIRTSDLPGSIACVTDTRLARIRANAGKKKTGSDIVIFPCWITAMIKKRTTRATTTIKGFRENPTEIYGRCNPIRKGNRPIR
jgi:hypothetical protein